MGVHNLIKHLKGSGKQYIPLSDNDKLKFIGIDGAHFLHYILNNNSANFDIEFNANKLSDILFFYIKLVCERFHIEGREGEGREECDVTILYVMDGYPPVSKNKIYKKKKYDVYKEIDVNKLMKLSFEKLKKELRDTLTCITFNFANNFDRVYGEGEMELLKSTIIGSPFKNVIISLDSDILAMIIFLKNPDIFLFTPSLSTDSGYFYDLNSLSQDLKLNHDQLINFILLYFIYFGSDYNYGLLTNPNMFVEHEIKTIIRDAVAHFSTLNFSNVLEIAEQCNKNFDKNYYLNKHLFYEAICAIVYYLSLGKNENLLKYNSPLIYQKLNK